MNPQLLSIIANVITTVLAPLAKAAWAIIKLKFKIGKNNTSIEKELEALKEALEELDDGTPITQEQKDKVIDAARDLIRGF